MILTLSSMTSPTAVSLALDEHGPGEAIFRIRTKQHCLVVWLRAYLIAMGPGWTRVHN